MMEYVLNLKITIHRKSCHLAPSQTSDVGTFRSDEEDFNSAFKAACEFAAQLNKDNPELPEHEVVVTPTKI